MSDSDDTRKTDELSAEDLDMVVGGASVVSTRFVKAEENVKMSSKGEEHRKQFVAPSEEKEKRE